MLFIYTARSEDGKIKTGTEEAKSETELAHLLRSQGYLLTSIKTNDQENKEQFKIYGNFIKSLWPISLFDKMLFAKHLAVMIRAGVPLTQAFEVLSKQTRNKKFGEILININKNIQSGNQLSDTLNNYRDVFSELFINMVKVGESSGNLEEVLDLLAFQMDKDYQLIAKIRGAVIYPLIIIIVMIIIGIIMMTTVVPQLISTFKDLHITLPLTTRVIIAVSGFLTKYIIISILAIILLSVLFWQFLKTKVGKQIFDWLTLHLPFINGVIQKINSARLARTLSSLIESGVPIVKSLQIVSKTLINQYYTNSIDASIKEIQKGQTLSETLKIYPTLYPLLITQMMEVGEKTGTLSNVLKELATFYEDDIDNLSKNLTTIVEPVLMVIIGVVVGFFAISMIQPIYSMMDGL